MNGRNADERVIEGFGDEWSRFDQSGVPESEMQRSFDLYFAVFRWDLLPKDAVGFDLGCGSGRWARYVAPRVGKLHCIDPSADALAVARRNLAGQPNCEFHCATVDEIPLPDGEADFGYSLGVLHHIPDTEAGLRDCVRKLKPGAPFLLYLYYAFDNRPWWYRWLWRASELPRSVVSRSPSPIRYLASQVLAATVYFPLARAARLAESAGIDARNFPLTAYRSRSFYTMRTDALDRFGTRLEQRFTRTRIERMMTDAGLLDIRFNETAAFWTACGVKA